MQPILRILACTTFWLIPSLALAKMKVSDITGDTGPASIGDLVTSVVNVLTATIEVVCTAVFVIGAFLFIISAGNDQRKTLGKDMMISALIGLAIVIGAQGIMNMTLFFIYGN